MMKYAGADVKKEEKEGPGHRQLDTMNGNAAARSRRHREKKKLENQLKLKYNAYHDGYFRKDFVTKTMDVREPDPEHPGMVGKFYTYYTNSYGDVCLHSP